MAKPTIGVFHRVSDGKEVHINVSHIDSYREDYVFEGQTFTTINMMRVHLGDPRVHHVGEPLAEVLQIIKEA